MTQPTRLGAWLLINVACPELTLQPGAATIVQHLQLHCRFTKEVKKKPKLDQYSSGGGFVLDHLPKSLQVICLWSPLIQHDHCSITAEAGLKYFDLQPGSGNEIVKGKVVKVCNLKPCQVLSDASCLSFERC